MVEVSETGLKEEEVELDLGLSIGGSFHRSEKPIQPDSKPNGFELHLKDHHQAWEGSFEDAQRESSSMAVMDPQTKREIHALRRLEAKKKREEKQQHKRAMREPEPEHQQRAFKREKTDPQRLDGGGGVSEWSNVNLNLNGTAATSMAPLHHPYAYVQLNNNAYAYPCVVPWMAPCGKKKNAGQPGVHYKGFRPFSGNGYRSEPNSERDCGDKKAKSDGSSMCSSSVVSDYQSSSHEGRGSSDSHSHSVQSKENNIRSQPEESASSHSTRSENLNGQSSTNHIVTQPHDQTKFKELEHSTMEDKAVQGDKKKPLSNDKKPPKPLPQTSSSSLSLSPALPKMPYVSTTGNGPNGKRVNGFLYRYSDSEVSIVCVCHGSTFSPAGFVQHAGGTDTSHPERHITVIRPAFG